MNGGYMNTSSHPEPEISEPRAAYSDLQPDVSTLDVDWHAAEFDRIAEQTLGDAS